MMRTNRPGLFQGEGALIMVGLLGCALSAILAVMLLLRGRMIAPEGDLLKPIEFNLAFGLYIITVAAFLPLAGFSALGRKAWRWGSIFIWLYAYGHESIQTLRGYDPRFSNYLHGALATLPQKLFGFMSLGIVIAFVILLYRVFRSTNAHYPLVNLGLKYGMLSGLVAVAAGFWMLTIRGRYTGGTGSVMWIHFLGFEGMKTMLLTSWLAQWSALSRLDAKRWVHAAGLAWLAACAGIWWQTALGRSPFTLTPVSAATFVALALWGYATLAVWPRTVVRLEQAEVIADVR